MGIVKTMTTGQKIYQELDEIVGTNPLPDKVFGKAEYFVKQED